MFYKKHGFFLGIVQNKLHSIVILMLLTACVVATGCGRTSLSRKITLTKNERCATIIQKDDGNGNIDGILVLFGGEPYLLKLKTHTITPLLDANGKHSQLPFYIAVSPDREKAAYIIGNYTQIEHKHINDELRIFDIHEPNIIRRVNVDDWEKVDGLVGWANENQLLLQPSLTGGPETAFSIPPDEKRPFGTTYLYNPFNGQMDEIQPSFSELYPVHKNILGWISNPILNPVSYRHPIYNASLSRVLLYLSDEQGMRFILWDVENKKALWEGGVTSNLMVEPQWSPSGKQIAFAPKGDIIILNQDGNETAYKNAILGYPVIYGLSWSPDEKQIAFWTEAGNTMTDTKLAVLNMETNHLTDYCIGAGGRMPIWSPDGKYIAVSISDKTKPDSQFNWRTVVIELKKNVAYLVADGAFKTPVGWLRENQ